ncbi:lysozyme inhibitor LprI family protein [Pontixanthobacter sp.]|uniref:lysozyme inhibitor LprI family protein n=1 Tax=Pontixanthobacter sp. TaxID=2792078 RepID=UPI003C7DC125
MIFAAFLSVLNPVPAIDCEEPMTQMAMNHCAFQDYMEADMGLNTQWALTSAAMKRRDKDSPPAGRDDRPGYFDALLAAQRAWIRYRDAHCQSEGYRARGGTLEPLLVSSCKAHLTRLRTADLEELARTY